MSGIRGLGLTRPGQAADGLPGDFALGRDDIPAEAQRGEPGRDLPAEIMAVLCANLDSLHPAEVRTATLLGIDTGRRPEEILALPVDCLARDSDGGHVLVYTNAKANRLARRLPITEATAAVVTAAQARARERFPHTPDSELKLLPSPRRNPNGHKPITIAMLENRHRAWADGLPALRTRDGGLFDKTKLVFYAYRHTYVISPAVAARGTAKSGIRRLVPDKYLTHQRYVWQGRDQALSSSLLSFGLACLTCLIHRNRLRPGLFHD